MKIKYKHIEFVKSDETENGKPVWECFNNDGDMLFEVTYYPEWKQYVSDESEPCVVLSSSCHRDIADFLDQLK